MIDWNHLSSEAHIRRIIEDSFQVPQLIFKHSTRCGTSAMALGRIERQWGPALQPVTPHFLDLLTYRKVSNAVAETFDVTHQSPQVLLIQNGVCTYATSHSDISVSGFSELLP
jgi:bacillithiol system protein YtxJ